MCCSTWGSQRVGQDRATELNCTIKIYASGFSELVESILCLLLVVKEFSLQKVVKMLEEVSICWLVRGQLNMADDAKLCI